MSLLDECKAIKPGYNGINSFTVEDEIDDVEKVEDEFTGDSRWSTFHTAVFRRKKPVTHPQEWDRYEYVALDYERPATEMQEGGDFHHEFYVVEPYEVTVTKYRKV